MKVTLIDYTGFGCSPERAVDLMIFTKSTRLEMDPELLSTISDQPWSWKEQQLQYMARTIPSSWEFVDYTFLLKDVTRAFTHQLVRTRTASYAQQTMRVLDKKGWTYGTGPSLDTCDVDPVKGKAAELYHNTMDAISGSYDTMVGVGIPIEDARGVLPTNIHTKIVVKMNMRTFVEMVRKRSSSRTQGEYRLVLDAMKSAVLKVHPWASIFIDRDKDNVIAELEKGLLGMTNKAESTRLIKLLDELRKEG